MHCIDLLYLPDMEKTAWPQHARSPHLAAQRWRRSQRIWTWASGGALALAASAWCRSSSHPQLCSGNGGYYHGHGIVYTLIPVENILRKSMKICYDAAST